MLQRNIVDLKLLPRCYVNRGIAIACGYLRNRPQLAWRQRPTGSPNPHHVAAVGALLIAAKRNAAYLQRRSVKLAAAVALYIGVELFEFRREVLRDLVKHGFSNPQFAWVQRHK